MEEIWNANPNVNRLFCFDDGNCFEKLSDALSYKKETQKTFVIKDRNVEVVNEESETTEESSEVKKQKKSK